MKKTVILINKARCKKCGDVIESKYRWDFVMCSCGSIGVDGGRDYLRRIGNPEDIVELSQTMIVDDCEDGNDGQI